MITGALVGTAISGALMVAANWQAPKLGGQVTRVTGSFIFLASVGALVGSLF